MFSNLGSSLVSGNVRRAPRCVRRWYSGTGIWLVGWYTYPILAWAPYIDLPWYSVLVGWLVVFDRYTTVCTKGLWC
jgi:hypothetical protein